VHNFMGGREPSASRRRFRAQVFISPDLLEGLDEKTALVRDTEGEPVGEGVNDLDVPDHVMLDFDPSEGSRRTINGGHRAPKASNMGDDLVQGCE